MELSGTCPYDIWENFCLTLCRSGASKYKGFPRNALKSCDVSYTIDLHYARCLQMRQLHRGVRARTMVPAFRRMAVRQLDLRLRRLEFDKSRILGTQERIALGFSAVLETRRQSQRQRLQVQSDWLARTKVRETDPSRGAPQVIESAGSSCGMLERSLRMNSKDWFFDRVFTF